MSSRVLSVLVSAILASPTWAAFITTDFTVGGDSRYGTANGFLTPPAAFSTIDDQQVLEISNPTAPAPGPTAADTLTTSLDAGGLSFDRRRASTSASVDGVAAEGQTLAFTASSFTQSINRDVRNTHYKSTAIGSASFVGEIMAWAESPGVTIEYDGILSMQAFAQNGAPGGRNNNSGWASAAATLTVENVTQNITAGMVTFVDEDIFQVFCGFPCLPVNRSDDPFSGTAFVPYGLHDDRDVLRITVDIIVSSDAYAKGFLDPAGSAQTASGIAAAGFDELNVTFLSTGAVPVPPAIWLLGSGLIGLIRVTRKKISS